GKCMLFDESPILQIMNKLMEDLLPLEKLKFNLFSVSQMCDKKNSVLFTDTECVVLSPDFKLTNESHILLKVSRNDNMYIVDLKNVIPQGGLTCILAKATPDESNLWHRRLGHGIKREFSVARTPQQYGVAKRKNRTLIEAAMTMLADSKLPTTFWAEAVNTACYVQNRVLVIKPHNKTPYEHFLGRKPTLSFMRPFGCPITILNTIDHLGKFDGKADEGFFVGYSTNSKAFRVFNSRTRIVEENLHVQFRNQSNGNVGKDSEVPSIEEPRINQEKDDYINITNNINTASDGNNTNNVNAVSSTVNVVVTEVNVVDPKTSIELLNDPNMPELEDIVYSYDDEDVGAKRLKFSTSNKKNGKEFERTWFV
ncbi:ribonuclease H-like domain-containing protein, partial [Tanacetum coccineum]